MDDFYVYVYFTATGAPCYVGKGHGARWRVTGRRNPRLRAEMRRAGGKLPVVIIRSGLTEQQAFDTEVALIAAIGRGKCGSLFNFTDGGEGTSGWKQLDHVKQAVSEARLAVPMWSDADKQRMSEQRTGRPCHDEASRARVSAQHKGHSPTAETRALMSAAKKGKPLSDEHRANLKAAVRPKSEAHKQKLREHMQRLNAARRESSGATT